MRDLFDSNLKSKMETWLEDRFAALCHGLGEQTPLSSLRISPPLAEWEANYFSLGLEEDLFAVDDGGHVTSPLLPSAGVAPLPETAGACPARAGD